MKKLNEQEQRLIDGIAASGGTITPDASHMANPEVVMALRGLERKKALYPVEDTDLPTFRLTGFGWSRSHKGW